jgi:hypothetical protein
MLPHSTKRGTAQLPRNSGDSSLEILKNTTARTDFARFILKTPSNSAPHPDDFDSSLKLLFAVLLMYYENDRFA